MRSEYKHNGMTWVDLESPTRQEIADIVEQFNVHAIVAEELLLPSRKPRVEMYPKYMFVILHFPALRHSHKTIEQEVDFVVGHDFMISVHYDTVDPLHKFSKVFEVSSVLDKGEIDNRAGYLFFLVLKKLYKAVEHEVDYVRQHLRDIEGYTFAGKEVRMVSEISQCARDLLNLRQTIEPHRDILHTLETEAFKFFGDDFLPYMRSLSNEYYKVHNHVMRNTESLHELRETNNSLLTTKQNEAMRMLTIMALFTFPLALIAAILGMDAKYNPILGQANDFWIILGIIISFALFMFWYFKHKKWL
ncbi:MAG: CorA family divalent cation transporter [Candidatus Kaiserbacteria bacterium]|nr:CorA family divalent cation transporter [Candidatus Kaiserbacteria bacterium]